MVFVIREEGRKEGRKGDVVSGGEFGKMNEGLDVRMRNMESGVESDGQNETQFSRTRRLRNPCNLTHFIVEDVVASALRNLYVNPEVSSLLGGNVISLSNGMSYVTKKVGR